jgi:hypothetical protein
VTTTAWSIALSARVGRDADLSLNGHRCRLTFATLLRVVDGEGSPQSRPRVEVADSGLADRRPAVTLRGDGQGYVVLPPLRRDRRHHVCVTVGGKRRSVWLTAPSTPLPRRTLRLSGSPRVVPRTPGTTRILVGGLTFVSDAELYS